MIAQKCRLIVIFALFFAKNTLENVKNIEPVVVRHVCRDVAVQRLYDGENDEKQDYRIRF